MSRGPKIADQRTALVLGAVLLVAGTYCLYDAYDARGKRRPFALHFLPGV
jgi:protein-tyrosine phosphatase